VEAANKASPSSHCQRLRAGTTPPSISHVHTISQTRGGHSSGGHSTNERGRRKGGDRKTRTFLSAADSDGGGAVANTADFEMPLSPEAP